MPSAIYDRQPNESAKAFAAFSIYLNLTEARSITAVAKQVNKSRTLIGRWSGVHKWQERCRAWDSDVEQQEHAVLIRERIEARKRHRKLALLALKQVATALPMLHPSQFSPGDVARMLECASKLERISLGSDEDDGGVAAVTIMIQHRHPDPDEPVRRPYVIGGRLGGETA